MAKSGYKAEIKLYGIIILLLTKETCVKLP